MYDAQPFVQGLKNLLVMLVKTDAKLFKLFTRTDSKIKNTPGLFIIRTLISKLSKECN